MSQQTGADVGARWLLRARLAGAVVALAGLVVLIGWVIGLPALRLGHGPASMKANTALLLAACGVALLLIARPAPGRRARAIAGCLGGLVTVAALLTASQDTLGWELGIDQWLVRTRGVGLDSGPGRMSLGTAAALGAAGLSLIALSGEWAGLSQVGALVTGLIGYVALLGYAFGVESLYRTAILHPIAAPTAACQILLSAGLLCASPQAGLMKDLISPLPGGVTARRMLPLVLMAPPLIGWLVMRPPEGAISALELCLLMAGLAVGAAGLVLVNGRMVNLEAAAKGREQQRRFESEARRAAMFASALDGIITMDSSGLIVDLNEAAERMFGYTAPEAVGREMAALMIPERMRAAHRRGLAGFLATGRGTILGRRVEVAAMRRDGAEFPAELTVVPAPIGDRVLFTGHIRDVTERRAAEEDRRKSAERYRRLVEDAPVGIVVNQGGSVVYANAEAVRILGAGSEADLVGTPMMQWIHPDSRGVVEERARALEAGAPAMPMIAETWRKMDGEALAVSVTAIAVEFGGKPAIQKVLRDETARRAAEERQRRADEALRRSEELYRLVVQSVREYAIYLVDPRGRVESWNEGAARLYGYEEAEALGKHISAFRTAEAAALVEPDVELRMAAERGSHLAEGWRVRKGGSRFWASVLTTALRSEDGSLRGFSRVTRDLSDARESEERLRESQERYRRLVDEAPVGIFVNQDDRFAYLNAEALKIFGASGADDLLGRPVLERVHPDSLPLAMQRLRALQSGQAVVPVVSQVWLRLDGQPVDASVTAATITYRGRPAYQVVFRDETARRKAEAALLEAKATLEERVKERTAELERLNAELQSFTYSVSHDLRAPIRHIDGFVRLLEERDASRLSDEGRRYLATVRQSAQRMGTLIDDLLRLSRLGRETLRPGMVDSEAMVRAVWEEVAGRSGVRTELDLKPLPAARADPSLLRQVWQNLLDNAVKYSGTREGARVTVEAVPDNGRVWYRVADNGVGFDPRYADKLFAVFQRLHRADEFPGTGVGLAIVKKVVDLHGGQVRARGEPGKGAAFEFTLGDGA